MSSYNPRWTNPDGSEAPPPWTQITMNSQSPSNTHTPTRNSEGKLTVKFALSPPRLPLPSNRPTSQDSNPTTLKILSSSSNRISTPAVPGFTLPQHNGSSTSVIKGEFRLQSNFTRRDLKLTSTNKGPDSSSVVRARPRPRLPILTGKELFQKLEEASAKTLAHEKKQQEEAEQRLLKIEQEERRQKAAAVRLEELRQKAAAQAAKNHRNMQNHKSKAKIANKLPSISWDMPDAATGQEIPMSTNMVSAPSYKMAQY